jgi:hypothetical protein
MSTLTDTTVDFNRPDIVLIDRENKTGLVTDIAAPSTHNISNTKTEENIKYENLALQIKNIRKINNISVYPLVILVEEVVTENFLKYLGNLQV